MEVVKVPSEISRNSSLSTLLQGLQKGLGRVAENAQKVASYSFEEGGTDSLAGVIVDLKAETRGVEAIAKTIKTVQDTEDEVLDILA